MTKLILVLLACTACASAPATTVSPVSTPVSSKSGPMLIGAAKWADSAGRLIEKATIAGNLQGLRNAGLLLDRALLAYPNDALLLQYQGYGLYREAGLLGGGSPSEKAELPLVAATARVKLLESLAAQPLPETHALLAMTMGRMIGLDQIYSPTLGPLIPKEMNAAIAMGPNNPRVWLLRGIQSFYTSPEYGGGLPGSGDAAQQSNRVVRDRQSHAARPIVGQGGGVCVAGAGSSETKQDRRGTRGV